MKKWFEGFLQRGQYSAPENTFIFRNKVLSILDTNAYWICMFLGLAGILAYICGYKKGGKMAKFSIVIYWVVAAICSAK